MNFVSMYLKDKVNFYVGVAKSSVVEITIIPDGCDCFDTAKKYCAVKSCGTAGRLKEVNEEYIIVYYDNSSIERSYIPINLIIIHDGKI